MGFKDFFLPKIAHSDPEVRKKAVEKTKDTILLQNVIKNDRDTSVREHAQKRLQELTA